MPRLDHLLARNLGVTRSAVRQLIADGLVTDAAGAPLVDPRQDLPVEQLPFALAVEGAPLQLHDEVHLLLHKPTGYVTALRDERHPVAYDLVEEAPLSAELRPVGRLDLDTSGLLLWTTSGPFLQHLTHPKRAYARSYQAALARPFQPPPGPTQPLQLDDGHVPNIQELRLLAEAERHPALAVPEGTTCLATITIVGGAYHEVRRIFAALGSHVLGLCRVRFGQLALPPDLAAGEFRLIQRDQV